MTKNICYQFNGLQISSEKKSNCHLKVVFCISRFKNIYILAIGTCEKGYFLSLKNATKLSCESNKFYDYFCPNNLIMIIFAKFYCIAAFINAILFLQSTLFLFNSATAIKSYHQILNIKHCTAFKITELIYGVLMSFPN